jgi:homospermidine synthase
MAKFEGKILVIGLGAVSRCTLPLLFKHIEMDPKNITVLDFNPETGPDAKEVIARGANFVQEKIERDTLEEQLARFVGPGDIIVDLAWNIDCGELLEWCHRNNVRYVNTSIEVWDPYEGAENKTPQERTLYARQMNLRKRMSRWASKKGPTAILDHGANPGLVQHFTKIALESMAKAWLSDYTTPSQQRDKITDALNSRAYNKLAMELEVKTIHISERDTQMTKQPKQVNEFVNTWSIEGFREEGIAPAEMGWGTHERITPPRAAFHTKGPMNQICLAQMGCRTWVRSWVPCGEIVGMVIRHGEAFSISEYLTVTRHGTAIYRPTVHYAYMPCDSAIASLHELQTRSYELQPKLRIMGDDIIGGGDELGCLLMGHDYNSWWIGSLLDIHEARRLVPGQNATTVQVAASVLAATLYMIDHPEEGVLLPDQLPHEEILKHAMPYLGPLYNKAVDWDPLKNWSHLYAQWGMRKPPEEDKWQFTSFLVNNISGDGY